jgi:cytochrome c peroxidase
VIRARLAVVLAAGAMVGCPKHRDRRDDHPGSGSGSGSAADARVPADLVTVGDPVPTLPPAPAQPSPPASLPAPGLEAPSDAMVALGEVLFYDGRLALDGQSACARCHQPAADYAGPATTVTADGKPNLRHAPALVNLAWQHAFGWDGRYATLADQLTAHVKGQQANPLEAAIARLGTKPMYRALAARALGHADEPPAALDADTARTALAAFALTRYQGDAPWDKAERAADPPRELVAGYQLFTGKAQCANCHAPPLYTDGGYHRLGLIATHDDGRGKLDPDAAGAFAAPRCGPRSSTTAARRRSMPRSTGTSPAAPARVRPPPRSIRRSGRSR